MSFGENKAVWMSCIAALLSVIALIWLLMSGSARTLVILFPESGDLKRNDPVMWHGYEIGKVTDIQPLVDNQVGVKIRLKEEYADRVRRGSSFTLKRAALFGYLGSNAVEVEVPEVAGPPYQNGEHIKGIREAKRSVIEDTKKVTAEYWEKIKQEAALLTQQYQRSTHRQDVEEVLAEVKKLAQKGIEQARGGLDGFLKDHQEEVAAVVKKLEAARDWMRKEGNEAGAQKLQEQIEQLLKAK